LIDKPADITSSDAVGKIKRMLKLKKAGHSGTLDKFASGLLVISTGRATKLSRFFLEHDKAYIGTVKLGISTDTDDLEGSIISQNPVHGISEEKIQEVLLKFSGSIEQTPPLYSALKISGKRASDIMRSGKDLELQKRPVTVYSISMENFKPEEAEFDIKVFCSKGTYIRAIARDIGLELGCGAHLKALRRIKSGNFMVEDAADFNEIEAFISDGKSLKNFIVQMDSALNSFSSVIVNDSARLKVFNGAVFVKEDAIEINQKESGIFTVFDREKNLIAMADIDLNNWQIKYLNVFI
jgi:tRNA pseudouridine55 synthase